MKILKLLFLGSLFIIFSGCKDGYIDDISAVKPGPDENAPSVSIIYPGEGALIRVKEEITSIDIKFEVVDDIEIKDISVQLDGNEIGTFTDFKDYRIAKEMLPYDNITNGQHSLTVVATDLSGKTTSESVSFEKAEPYKPIYDGEIFYMPLNGDFLELVSVTMPTQVGTPGFAGEGKLGNNAYAGAKDSYLTFPTEGLLGTEFSAAFWYKVNPVPDRAGILVIGPPDAANPEKMNNRKNGFRFFRENAGGKQRIKLNVGHGAGDNWFDGGILADIDPAAGAWVHVAFTISPTECVVYINGQVVKQAAFAGVDWTGCDILSIGSGAPRFTGWNHLSDHSYIDELRLFNKALTQEEIQVLMGAG